ncbi:peptidoglycan DD-metalloendopeptidase family protein [Croceibacter atlanticus]|jgi:murein DD-endopeptidase MepM/ murein hydrolase activator NlpD|uniref:peptidoglycan DD-metalloendopeptidase family protein n=1 Tax=Croceibacter atlanticus TaxID=313588 RepID=UPI0024BB1C86|nr:peptidoglycan DD-metalloendopeptidase family protein [Croceibacter atlanticus]
MNTSQFKEFLNSISSEFIPIIDSKYTKDDYIHIDLSTTNEDLKSIDVSSSSQFEIYIKDYLKKHDKKVAYGGYIETRGIYNRSSHFNQQDPNIERNIHLGLDVWVPANTNVLAPLKGTVHSFKNNTNFGDYGPTIILEHHLESIVFYTLYGHLSTNSLKNIDIGQVVEKGDCIAQLGTAEINGDYAPHLHFQIIKDMGRYSGDYPGVTSKLKLKELMANGEDPKLLLNLPS